MQTHVLNRYGVPSPDKSPGKRGGLERSSNCCWERGKSEVIFNFFSRRLFIMVMERSQWPRLRGRVGDKRATVIFKRECRPARQSRHLDAPAERRLSDFCSSAFLFIHCFVAIDLKLPVHIETLIVQPYLSLRVMQIAHEPISCKCPAQRRLLEAEECPSCSVIVLEGH